ncbi:aldehyde dehydrogenase family protein [Streptomyces sp. H27-G5]|uniref:aldehyde dehydrogenase family protein n=1 Tax=Streptomyces sp. H27-G5 TaxID=2996698 RepID=UPI00226D82CE|nr:aldehyde dehydrogenase family protein [Streptomyces sp. H27-G5]MCY0917381.1 aldehyde dehydrogenase family protein [Streptomyces sp. H27-G5]
MTLAIPVLRDGRERTSRDTRVLNGVDGVPLATVHEAPALVTRLTVKAMRQAPRMAPDERLAVLAKAGALFGSATLGGVTPEQYCRVQALASGVPVDVARRTLGRIGDDCARLGEVVDRQAPVGAGRTARWVRRGSVFGVVAPSNHPATHGAWLQAIAMGYKVLVRPGARDPFTPLRLVRALLEAGLEPGWISLLPGPHAAADTLVETADLSLVYGSESTVARLRGNDRVLVRGPGRSKILVDGPLDEATLDHLVAEIAADGGVRCTNTTAVLTSGDHRALAEALAERLAALPAHPVTDDRAVLPVRPRREGEGLRAALDLAAAGAPDLVARHHEDGPLPLVAADAVALRPAVMCVDRSDHPGLATELPFPCVWVAPWRRSEGVGPLDDSLALTLLTDDASLVSEALESPGVRTVLHGRVPGWWKDPFLPHDGYLGQFLKEARGFAASS